MKNERKITNKDPIIMSYKNAVIEDINKNFPEFLRPGDLVATGLYKSRSDLCWSMKRGLAPPFIKVSSHKVIFPRAALLMWLDEKTLY